jgi:hypothetical protein
MHIYAFGSVCRGEISLDSDIDLLAVVEGQDFRFDPNTFSIYSYKRIEEIWQEGNPFAWHLSLQSKLIFSSTQDDFLKSLGSPKPYKRYVQDCEKFFTLFIDAYNSILTSSSSVVFDFSTVFLSIRNIATCFSLGVTQRPDFSRNSALSLEVNNIPLALDVYQILERSRILCTRGYGNNITNEEIDIVIQKLDKVSEWMQGSVNKAKQHERI